MQNEINEKSFNDGLHADVLTHEVTFEDPLTLACGLILPTHKLVFETYGTLNEGRNNAILICHALSGNQHAAGLNTEGRPGWWDHYIGPDKPIDTNKFFVVCPNNIGSCFGSTGPNTINEDTNKSWGPEFPSLEVSDWVNSQVFLMEYLKIKCWSAVIGGSLGGMQAMHWAVSHSSRLKSAVVIAASLKLSAQNIAFNEVARRAIMSDPHFHDGAYLDHDVTPKQGLALARMIGHLTYLSDSALGRKFGRLVRNGDLDAAEKALVEFEISSYLNYQGDKFADKFDANSYILITKMLDYFDLAHSFNDEAVDAFSKSSCNFLVVSFSSDWRFSPQCSKEITDALIEADKNVSYLQIDSDQGHDAFLLPNSRYEDGLRAFLFATSNHLNGTAK